MILFSRLINYGVLLALLAALILTSLHNGYVHAVSEPFSKKMYCGFAFGTGRDESRYWLWTTKKSLQDMRVTGSNTIQISAYVEQVGVYSKVQQSTTREQALVHVIRLARRAGYTVFLKPTVSLTTNDGAYLWRGVIPPTWLWFKQLYIPYITHMARLAQHEKVDILAIGSEYRRTEKATNLWRHTIRKVRAIYSGNITYIANHDSYKKVRFWRMLDFISISGYWKLIPSKQSYVPNFDQTVKLLQIRANVVKRYLRRNKLDDMKVLIAEVGFQSKGGTVNYAQPWNWDAEGPINFYAQLKMYNAFMRVFLNEDWCSGIIFWHWDLDHDAGYTHSKALYTPQDKPAQRAVRRRFHAKCR